MERWAKQTEDLISHAIEEDIGDGDITTDATVDPEESSTGFLFSKEDGILAGIDVAMKVFHMVDPSLKTKVLFRDGSLIEHGHKIAEIQGAVGSILKGERIALNILSRMTGIASTTAMYVNEIKDNHAKVLDTRKTIPTMRHLDKYAVRIGGGSNHRYGLFDMALIKDNHITVAGGIRIAVERVTEYLKKHEKEAKIEVECKTYGDVTEAIYTAVDIIMLDNMEIGEIEKSVSEIRRATEETGRTIRVEVSGDITLNNIRQVAETGVDYISVGALTHSVQAHDFSLLFEEL